MMMIVIMWRKKKRISLSKSSALRSPSPCLVGIFYFFHDQKGPVKTN